jgi:hypothetical protein
MMALNGSHTQFSSFGGTVGLAQCAAVLNAKVKSYILALVASGVLTPADLESLAEANAHGGLNSIQTINDLSPHLQSLIREAFRKGTMWCFLSLIPWSALAVFLSLFLSTIQDTDRKEDVAATTGKKVEAGNAEEEGKTVSNND